MNFYVECDARTDDVIAGGQQVGARPSHAPRHRQRPPEAAANRWALFHFVPRQCASVADAGTCALQGTPVARPFNRAGLYNGTGVRCAGAHRHWGAR